MRVLQKREKLRETFKDTALFTVGASIHAISVNVFTAPNKIAPGGFTGLSTMINFLTGIPIGATVFLLNIPLFIVSYKVFGKDFIIKTIFATFLLSVSIDVFSPILPVYNDDRLLATLFGGFLSGGGLAIILYRGATTGGTDILAKLIRLKWAHISMGTVILFADMIIIILSAVVYRNVESALYALVTIFVSSKTVDFVLYGRGYGKILLIFTNNPVNTTSVITNELGRGISVIDAKGGYTGNKKYMLVCAVRTNEISKILRLIRTYDKNSFVIVSEAGEIFGEGFKALS